MVKHAGFDLEAFCAAVERRDVAAQLHAYADQAEVRLTLLDDPQAVRTLLGRVEIEHWIRQRCADNNTTFQVTHRWIDAEEMMVTEECRRPDGTSSLTASTARVCQAHIITQSVVGLRAD